MERNLAQPTKKFMFDLNDFDEAAIRRKQEAARRPTFSREEMAASRQTGYEEGRLAGIAESVASQEAQIRDLMQQIVIMTEGLAQEEADRMATFIDQAALIAVQALSKTLPALLDIMAVDQIAAFVNGVLEDQVKGQTVQIFVAPARESALRTRFETMSEALRRKGVFSIAADPGLNDLQCRLEWTGGGADWNPSDVSDRLLRTVIDHLPVHLKPQAYLPPVPEPAAMSTEQDPTIEVCEDGGPNGAMDGTRQTPHTDASTSGDAP